MEPAEFYQIMVSLAQHFLLTTKTCTAGPFHPGAPRTRNATGCGLLGSKSLALLDIPLIGASTQNATIAGADKSGNQNDGLI